MALELSEIRAKAAARRSLPSPKERRAIREMAGCTRADIATPLGVTATTISNWETGRRTPRGNLLVAYVEVLDALKAS